MTGNNSINRKYALNDKWCHLWNHYYMSNHFSSKTITPTVITDNENNDKYNKCPFTLWVCFDSFSQYMEWSNYFEFIISEWKVLYKTKSLFGLLLAQKKKEAKK